MIAVDSGSQCSAPARGCRIECFDVVWVDGEQEFDHFFTFIRRGQHERCSAIKAEISDGHFGPSLQDNLGRIDMATNRSKMEESKSLLWGDLAAGRHAHQEICEAIQRGNVVRAELIEIGTMPPGVRQRS